MVDRTSDTQVPSSHERLTAIIDDCLVRRAKGESVDDDVLIETYPELMPELAEQLRFLRLAQSAESDIASVSREFNVRCPHCHRQIELTDDTPPREIECPSCGSSFRLADDEAEQSLPTGIEQIGHFKLLEKIGTGAFGTVWSAQDTQLDRLVAIKIPRKGHLNSEDVEKFIHEARVAAGLRHPNIVRVHEVGKEGDRIYIVTDIVHGVDLAKWLARQRATPAEAAELCAKIAGALQHAHEQGVIHRDLKPSNIMLDTAGVPYLMDFGLAKRDAGDVTITLDGKLVGTPAYMSPEQARGPGLGERGRSADRCLLARRHAFRTADWRASVSR